MAHTDTRRCVPGASYCSVADLLIQTKQRLVVHIRISVKQANLLAALQHHTAQCACDADSAALAQVPDVQANQIRQLREKWTANDDQAEAMNVAMLLETEEHELEMAKLYARITELENEYSPWKANIDKVESATCEASTSGRRLQVEVEEGRADLSRLQASRQILVDATAHMDAFEQKQQLCRKFFEERFLLKQAEAKQAQQTLHHHSQQSEQLLVKSAAKLGELYQQLAEVGWQQQQQQQQQPCGAAPSTASGVEALLEGVLAMRQTLLTALQQHQEAAAAAQAEVAQAAGAEPGAVASSSQQPQGCQAEMAVEGETFECAADKGATMLKGTSSGMDMQRSLRSKRMRDDAEEEEDSRTKRQRSGHQVDTSAAVLAAPADADAAPSSSGDCQKGQKSLRSKRRRGDAEEAQDMCTKRQKNGHRADTSDADLAAPADADAASSSSGDHQQGAPDAPQTPASRPKRHSRLRMTAQPRRSIRLRQAVQDTMDMMS